MIDSTFLKILGLSAFVLLAMPPHPAAAAPGVLDVLTFGNAASEKAHHFEGRDTQTVTAALGQPARVSLPGRPPTTTAATSRSAWQ